MVKQGYGLDRLINDSEACVCCIVADQGYGLDQLEKGANFDVCMMIAYKKGNDSNCYLFYFVERGLIMDGPKDGKLTYCLCSPEQRSKGDCNHIAHINNEEDPQEFLDRMTKEFKLIEEIYRRMPSEEKNELAKKAFILKNL